MNIKFNKLAVALAGAALSLAATQANASTFVDLVNKNTTYASAVKIDFGTATADNNPTYSQGLATFTGGTLYATAIQQSARPVGSTGAWWSVGTSPTPQLGPGVLTFSSGVKYVGFLWGSPDTYNTVQFVLNGGAKTVTVLGSSLPVNNGNQAYSDYHNFFADGADVVTKVVFTSSQNAFEMDNFAYSVTAVPEPESYALMLAGLGLMGAIARRRNNAKAA